MLSKDISYSSVRFFLDLSLILKLRSNFLTMEVKFEVYRKVCWGEKLILVKRLRLLLLYR